MSLLFLTGAFDSILTDEFSIGNCILILGISLLLGFAISLVYHFTKRKIGYNKEFLTTLIMLPIIVSLVVFFVRDNIAGGLSLAGIFALTRFRSEQKNTEDLSYIFMSVAVGLACGLGYVLASSIICLILLLVLLIIHFTNYGMPNSRNMTLKIIIPEDINYDGIFDEILNEYCSDYHLSKIKTSDFGTMFELTYFINVKDQKLNKQMIDEIRVKNGNMNVTLVVRRYNSK